MTVMKQRHNAAAHVLIQATAREKWMPPSVYVALLFFLAPHTPFMARMSTRRQIQSPDDLHKRMGHPEAILAHGSWSSSVSVGVL